MRQWWPGGSENKLETTRSSVANSITTYIEGTSTQDCPVEELDTTEAAPSSDILLFNSATTDFWGERDAEI